MAFCICGKFEDFDPQYANPYDIGCEECNRRFCSLCGESMHFPALCSDWDLWDKRLATITCEYMQRRAENCEIDWNCDCLLLEHFALQFPQEYYRQWAVEAINHNLHFHRMLSVHLCFHKHLADDKILKDAIDFMEMRNRLLRFAYMNPNVPDRGGEEARFFAGPNFMTLRLVCCMN